MRALACLLEAFGWLNRSELRAFIWLPLLINIMIFGGGTWALLHYFEGMINYFLPPNSWLNYFRWILWPLIALTLCVVVYYTFSLFANILAAPFNGFLAEAVEKIETGRVPQSGRSIQQEMVVSVIQEIRKTGYFVACAIPILLLGFVPVVNIALPIIWFFYSAWVAYLQYMDYPMSNNGIVFSEQRSRLRNQPLDAFGFGGLATLLFIIPIINLIAMPVAVIGATLHWNRNVRSAAEQ